MHGVAYVATLALGKAYDNKWKQWKVPSKRQWGLQKLQKLRIFDDDFLKEVFDGNIEDTELVLNVVFDRDEPDMRTPCLACLLP